MRVFIGYDERESAAAQVAVDSLRQTSGLVADLLIDCRLRERGLFWRPVLRPEGARALDVISNQTQSTDFALTRFLVPIVQLSGWALFTDCDVVFLEDVRHMLHGLQPGKAVYVVKHRHHPTGTVKMDGQLQRDYPRKNWSSVMLFNCDHPANRRLTLQDVNTRHREYLHGFGWLADDEIGELDPRWNWLVGEQQPPDSGVLRWRGNGALDYKGIAHFTTGGPFTPGWTGGPFDHVWYAAQRRGTKQLQPAPLGAFAGVESEGGEP